MIEKALTSVKPGIWRWDGVDADHGFPIVGYAPHVTGELVLVDPPGTSGSREELSSIGEPQAILLTNMWHVRGAAQWAETFGLSIYAHASAREEVEEAGGRLDVEVSDGDRHFGWEAVHISAAHEDARFDETCYWHESSGTLIIGDLLTAEEDGTIHYGPHKFSQIPISALHPLTRRLKRLSPRLLLSAHLGPREDVEELFRQALAL